MKKLNIKKIRESHKATYDPSLDNLDTSMMGQEKLQKANETLARMGLPKEWTKNQEDK